MVELLIGKKGTGKTKVLIDRVNSAAGEASGNVVFVSNDTSRNMYDIKTGVRMYDTSEFDVNSWEEFFGFLCGIISGNFDITNIFVDGTLKIVNHSLDGFEDFLKRVEQIGDKFNISFVMSVSVDADTAPDYIKKYA